jgi:hypothetical protein
MQLRVQELLKSIPIVQLVGQLHLRLTMRNWKKREKTQNFHLLVGLVDVVAVVVVVAVAFEVVGLVEFAGSVDMVRSHRQLR